MTSVLVSVPAPFVAEMVTLVTPTAVGLPEMMPVVVSIASPAGSPVALKLTGAFNAVIW